MRHEFMQNKDHVSVNVSDILKRSSVAVRYKLGCLLYTNLGAAVKNDESSILRSAGKASERRFLDRADI